MLMINKKKQYVNVSEGEHLAVIVDIRSYPNIVTRFGTKDRLAIQYLTEEQNDGKPLGIFEFFNASWNEKANLRKRVKSVLGKDPGEQYDLEDLINRNVRIIVEHVEADGKKYANITTVLRPLPGTKTLEVPKDFKRGGNDKNKATEPVGVTKTETENGDEIEMTDADIPF